MKQFALSCILILYAFSSMAQQNLLSKYKWENRILIIYSNDVDDHEIREQKKKYELQKSEYNERDLLVFQLSDNNFQNLSNQLSQGVNISSLKEYLSIEKSDRFKVILIGKDGGIKLESEQLLSNQKIFATIDAMPMRRNEMSDN